MLIHDRFIFLHVPKTGGMFLRDVLKRELAPGTVLEGPITHATRGDIPEALQARPILAYVRNPWDWYVSIYHHGIAPSTAPPANPYDARIMAKVFGNYTYDFGEMVRVACSKGDLGLEESEAREAMEHGSLTIRLILQGYDPYTACILAVIGAESLDPNPTEPIVAIGRHESLVDDLESFVAEEEIVVADGAFSRMRDAKPINASTHRHYRDYYDDGLRRQVGESCGLVVERFGYDY